MEAQRLQRLLNEMSPELIKALHLVAKHGAEIQGDWWIIGSTAALLAGVDSFNPDDVDLFGKSEVMTAFLRPFGHEPVSTPNPHQLKSNPYQRITVPNATPIEVMGGLEVFSEGHWRNLVVKTRLKVNGFGAPLWVPSMLEQVTIFEMFGRPKDLAKAAILRSSNI